MGIDILFPIALHVEEEEEMRVIRIEIAVHVTEQDQLKNWADMLMGSLIMFIVNAHTVIMVKKKEEWNGISVHFAMGLAKLNTRV